MKIGIIDADLIERKKHRFPNLACMKLSAHHKEKGDQVSLMLSWADIHRYDKVYISKVFTDTFCPEHILERDNVEYGGTGFFYDKAPPLPAEVEHTMPDYDLYREWATEKIALGEKKDKYRYYLNTSIGFTTRGCFRKCEFCVNQNSGGVVRHSPVEEFFDPKNSSICMLDDNVLGSKYVYDIWESLARTGRTFEYKQGMDFRLLNEKKIRMMINSKINKRAYIFAFDDIKDKEIMIKKFELFRSITDCFARFYVLCGFDKNSKYDDEFWERDLYETFERIKIIMEYGSVPYIMKYEKWVNSPWKGTYSNISNWCNILFRYKKMSFEESCKAQTRWNGGKEDSTMRHYKKALSELPDLAKEYFGLRYEEITKFKTR